MPLRPGRQLNLLSAEPYISPGNCVTIAGSSSGSLVLSWQLSCPCFGSTAGRFPKIHPSKILMLAGGFEARHRDWCSRPHLLQLFMGGFPVRFLHQQHDCSGLMAFTDASGPCCKRSG